MGPEWLGLSRAGSTVPSSLAETAGPQCKPSTEALTRECPLGLGDLQGRAAGLSTPSLTAGLQTWPSPC